MKKLILSAGGALCLILANHSVYAANSAVSANDDVVVTAVSDVFAEPVFEHEIESESDSPTWTLTSGGLKEQLLAWSSESANWNIIWRGDTESDLLVEVPHTFFTTLDQAVVEVVKAYAREGANIRLDYAQANNQLIITHWGQ